MSGDRIDPELLAGFLDGTASADEREGVMRTLAQSEDAYAEFIEAAAIRRDLEDRGASVTAAPSPIPAIGVVRRTSSRWIVGSALLAASIVGVILLGRLGQRGPTDVIQLAQTTRLTQASGSGSVERTLGANWDQPPWSVTRGNAASLATQPRAFRAGARYAEMEVAASASDSAAVARAATDLADLLTSVEAGAPLAARVLAISRQSNFGGPSERGAAVRQARTLLTASPWFDLGVWTETARLAISARHVAFFAIGSAGRAEARRILESEVSPADSAGWSAAIDPLRLLVGDSSTLPTDLESLNRAVRNTIVVAAQ